MTPATTPIRRSAKVIARHSSDCKYKDEGPDYKKCRCSKSVLLYEGDRKTNRRISAKTRSWETAEKFARDLLDSFDPDKIELKQFRAAKERQQVRIEEAVALFIADMITRLGDNGTVAMARSMFGHIDPETKDIIKSGHLFTWINSLPEPLRPTHIVDLTASLLTGWRSSWNFGSDLTASQRWMMVKGFFAFCEAQGWIAESPARKLKPLKAKKGGRTTIFTDKQYASILDAVYIYEPENVPLETKKAWQQRLTIFIELLRWSGMALADGVQFRPESVDKDGVLRYRRAKTDELATVQLPEHVITLLRDIPLEHDSVGADQPFRTRAKRASDTATWARRLRKVFTLAGIIEIRTENGRLRPPHAHMFRDSFAVWNLRHGVSIYAVAKMVGHSDPTTTAKSYLPFVQELEASTLAEARKALAAGMPKKSSRGRKIVNIAAR